MSSYSSVPTSSIIIYSESIFSDPCGCTYFPDDRGTPLIDVSTNLPLDAIVETMAHELAHIIAGVDAGHGTEWEQIFEKIHNQYLKNEEMKLY